MSVDLHVHSLYSDGRLLPGEVVREALARGVEAVGLVDHDVLDGLQEAVDEAQGTSLEIVPGIEMTARGDGQRAVHILGYFLDPEDRPLRASLGRARALMARHVDLVLEAIRSLGYTLDVQHLERYRQRYAGGAALVLGMMERGVLRDARPGTGMHLLRMAAREPRAYTVKEAIDLIHGAGGVASLAHPAKLRRGKPLLEADDLRPFADAGIDALEAWQWIPNGWGSEHYCAVAQQMGLLVSGGSDDHGKRMSDGRMRLGGQDVPRVVLERLRERASWWQARRPSR